MAIHVEGHRTALYSGWADELPACGGVLRHRAHQIEGRPGNPGNVDRLSRQYLVGLLPRTAVTSRETDTNMSSSGTNTTEQQRRPTETPPAGYIVSSEKGHRLLVRRPDGRPMRTRPSGRLVATDRVERVQSYLHIPAT